MQEKHKSFIKRHIKIFILNGDDPESAIEKSYSILDSEQETKNAISTLRKTGRYNDGNSN